MAPQHTRVTHLPAVGPVPMKRSSPTELEVLDTRSIYSEFFSPFKYRKMAEMVETKTPWEKTWQAIDFDDGTFLLVLPNIFFVSCNVLPSII